MRSQLNMGWKRGLAIVLVLAMLTITGGVSIAVEAVSVKLNKKTLSMKVGATKTLKVSGVKKAKWLVVSGKKVASDGASMQKKIQTKQPVY